MVDKTENLGPFDDIKRDLKAYENRTLREDHLRTIIEDKDREITSLQFLIGIIRGAIDTDTINSDTLKKIDNMIEELIYKRG